MGTCHPVVNLFVSGGCISVTNKIMMIKSSVVLYTYIGNRI